MHTNITQVYTCISERAKIYIPYGTSICTYKHCPRILFGRFMYDILCIQRAMGCAMVRFPHLSLGLHCSPRCQQQGDHLTAAIPSCPVEGSAAILAKAETQTQTHTHRHRQQVRAAHTCCRYVGIVCRPTI